jgi:hypothetical protein
MEGPIGSSPIWGVGEIELNVNDGACLRFGKKEGEEIE